MINEPGQKSVLSDLHAPQPGTHDIHALILGRAQTGLQAFS
jgi:hypothetical protein